MLDRHPRILADLRARLAEPQRVYHAQAHVDALLEAFRARRATVRSPDAVELAIWFHDAVYRPGASDNERRSAVLLRTLMDGLVPAATLAAAETMIRATERHAVPDGLPAALAADVAVFLDMDMAILGAAQAAYDDYAAGVAREFIPAVGESAYRQGRTAFLRGTLESGRPLFLTDQARAELEGPARSNMRRELATLDRRRAAAQVRDPVTGR
jgi:predicted metal-dependent HD superfamily phosphohydrolase